MKAHNVARRIRPFLSECPDLRRILCKAIGEPGNGWLDGSVEEFAAYCESLGTSDCTLDDGSLIEKVQIAKVEDDEAVLMLTLRSH